MSSRIPKRVREKVLFLWNQGFSRDEIANATGIGTGTVSEIMKIYRQNDSDIDLNQELMEIFWDKIDEHCFKRGIEPEEFIKKVDDVCKLASKIKVPVEELPSHIVHNLDSAFEKYAAKLAEVNETSYFEPN